MTTTTVSPVQLDPAKVRKAMKKRNFAALASNSQNGQPHVAGVLYELVGTELWLNTLRQSRKAKNIETNGRVGITIPVRRIPVGPPSTIQFQGTAEVFDRNSQEVKNLVNRGELKSITSHGELELDGSCFVRVTPQRRIHTYGLGLSLAKLIRDPLNASGSVTVAELMHPVKQ